MSKAMIDLYLFFVLAGIVWWIYYPAIDGPFLYDDLAILEGMKGRTDPLQRHRHPVAQLLMEITDIFRWRLYRGKGLGTPACFLRGVYNWLDQRPLTTLTYRLDLMHSKSTYSSDLNYRRWHQTSMLIHIANAGLVLAILSGWFHLPAAFLGALVFACHPMATAAVSYLAGRSSALCSLFVLAAILLFQHRAYLGPAELPLLAIASVLAILSKPEAIVLPFLIGGMLCLIG